MEQQQQQQTTLPLNTYITSTKLYLSFGSRSCQYFATLFHNKHFAEAKAGQSDIRLPNQLAMRAFPVLLDYMCSSINTDYDDDKNKERYSIWNKFDTEQVTAVRYLGKYFGKDKLQEEVLDYIDGDLSFDNCHVYLLHSKIFHDEEVYERVIRSCAYDIDNYKEYDDEDDEPPFINEDYEIYKCADAAFWLEVFESMDYGDITTEWIIKLVDSCKDQMSIEEFQKFTSEESNMPCLDEESIVPLLKLEKIVYNNDTNKKKKVAGGMYGINIGGSNNNNDADDDDDDENNDNEITSFQERATKFIAKKKGEFDGINYIFKQPAMMALLFNQVVADYDKSVCDLRKETSQLRQSNAEAGRENSTLRVDLMSAKRNERRLEAQVQEAERTREQLETRVDIFTATTKRLHDEVAASEREIKRLKTTINGTTPSIRNYFQPKQQQQKNKKKTNSNNSKAEKKKKWAFVDMKSELGKCTTHAWSRSCLYPPTHLRKTDLTFYFADTYTVRVDLKQ